MCARCPRTGRSQKLSLEQNLFEELGLYLDHSPEVGLEHTSVRTWDWKDLEPETTRTEPEKNLCLEQTLGA